MSDELSIYKQNRINESFIESINKTPKCSWRELLHLFSFKTPIFTSYEMKSSINNSS